MTDRSTAQAARPTVRTVVLLALAFALSGCVARGTGDGQQRTPSAPEAVPAVAVPAPATPAPPLPLPRLIGLPQEDVVRILGRPAFQRQDAPALLLRYRGDACILDLFLYPPIGRSVAGSPPAVEHVEARTAEGQRTTTGDCLAEVMKARAAAVAG